MYVKTWKRGSVCIIEKGRFYKSAEGGRAMNDELCVSFLFVSNILSVFFSMIAEMNQVSHKMVACRCD